MTTQTTQSFNKVGESLNVYVQQVNVTSKQLGKLSESQSDAGKESLTFAQKLEKVGKGLHDIGQRANEVGESLSKLTAGLSFWDTFNAFAEQEKSAISLKASLEANGRQVDELIGVYEEFANNIQETTVHEADQVIELLKLAEGMDVTGEAAKRAVKNAIALADAQGKQAESVLRATAALEKGAAKAIGEYLPGLRAIEDESERVVEAQRLLNNMYNVTNAITETTSGKIKQVTNAYGDFKELIGGLISQGLAPLVSLLRKLIDEFNALPAWVKTSIAITLTLISTLAVVGLSVGAAILAFKGFAVALAGYTVSATAASVASVAMKATLVGAFVAIGYAAINVFKDLTGVSDNIKQLNRDIQESERLTNKWADRFTNNTQDILKSAEKLDDISKSLFLTKELDSANKEIEGYKRLLASATKEFDEFNTRWNRLTAESAVKALNSQLDDSKKKLELARTRVEQLRSALNEASKVKLDQKLTEDIQKFIDKLKLQNDTLGMTGDQIEIYKFQLRDASNALIDVAKNQAAFNDQLKGLTAVETKAKDLITQLKNEAATLGMDATTARITLLKNEVTKLEDSLDDMVKKLPLEEFLKYQDNLLKTKAALRELTQASQALDRGKMFRDMQNEAFRLNRAAEKGTPIEQYNKRIKELQQLWDRGLNEEGFIKGAEDAAKQFDILNTNIKKTTDSIKNLDAAKFGSAEAAARTEAFLETIRRQAEESKQRQNILNQLRYIPPSLQGMAPQKDMNVVASADRTIMQDRETSIKLLQSIDKNLDQIKAKPTSLLGLAEIVS